MDDRAGMVIIGAGECGGRAALALREHGYDGAVTLVGDEPHLPYERPPLSKDVLALTDAPPPTMAFRRRRDLGREAHRLHHSVRARRRSIVRQNRCALRRHRRWPTTKLLLATGAAPRKLPLAGQAGDASPTSAPSTTRWGSAPISAPDAASPSSAAASSASSLPQRAQARRPGHRRRGAAARPDARRARGDRRDRRSAASRRRRRSLVRRRPRRNHHASGRRPRQRLTAAGSLPISP